MSKTVSVKRDDHGRAIGTVTDMTSYPAMNGQQEPTPDFSKPHSQVRFTVDGDTFQATPDIAAEVLVHFAGGFMDLSDRKDPRDQFAALIGVLELVLLPDSYTRMVARTRDREHPVTLDQLSEIVMWLMGKYGLRPTQQPSNSPDGRANPVPGMSFAGNTQVKA